MSVKNTYLYQILTSKSLAASFDSPVTFIRNGDNISYQINTTTTDSIGSFDVQVSDDYSLYPDGTENNPGNWVTLTLSGTPTINGAPDQIGISLNQVPYNAIRLHYTSSTPGTGTVNAYITAKRLGG